MSIANTWTTPLDMDIAAETFGAACGHGALAAATDKRVVDVLRYFPGIEKGKRWVNIPDMHEALTALGRRWWSVAEKWPANGVVIVQFTGPWTKPGVPPTAACKHTHWIAAREGYVWDANSPDWMPLAVWEALLVPELMPKRGDGWRIKRGFEIKPPLGSEVRPRA